MRVDHLPDSVLHAFTGYILYKENYFEATVHVYKNGDDFVTILKYSQFNNVHWIPTVSWEQCGPLIDKYDIYLERNLFEGMAHSKIRSVMVKHRKHYEAIGNTRMRAACRVIIKSVFGEEVDIDFDFGSAMIEEQKKIPYLKEI